MVHDILDGKEKVADGLQMRIHVDAHSLKKSNPLSFWHILDFSYLQIR